jgi:hypothetical protein
MQCHGSANLELAIPGWSEPDRDDMAGAKGVGSRMHASFAELAFMDSLYLDKLSIMVSEYLKLNWRVRRHYMDDVTEPVVLDWFRKQVIVTDIVEETAMLRWLQDLDRNERLQPAMLRFVAQTILELSNLKRRYAPLHSEIYAEKQIECTWLKSAPKTTPDLAFIQLQRITVVDYKTGKIPVDVIDNSQLMFYAMSVLWNWYAKVDWDHVREVVMIVWQPGNYVEHTITINELLTWAREARRADIAITAGDLTMTPGKSCTFCPANPHGRGDKTGPWCPPMMSMLYPDTTDEEAILTL